MTLGAKVVWSGLAVLLVLNLLGVLFVLMIQPG